MVAGQVRCRGCQHSIIDHDWLQLLFRTGRQEKSTLVTLWVLSNSQFAACYFFLTTLQIQVNLDLELYVYVYVALLPLYRVASLPGLERPYQLFCHEFRAVGRTILCWVAPVRPFSHGMAAKFRWGSSEWETWWDKGPVKFDQKTQPLQGLRTDRARVWRPKCGDAWLLVLCSLGAKSQHTNTLLFDGNLECDQPSL